MGSLEWRLLPCLGAVLCLLLGRSAGGPSSLHTLHYFTTAVWEPGWRIPRLTSLMYVDDQLLGRYDKATDQCVPQSSWIQEISRDNPDFWTRNTGWDCDYSVVLDLMILKNLYNQSRGIHTLQLLYGCEMSGDDSTRGFAKYGYNGRDFLHLDLATLTWISLNAEAEPVKRKWDAEQSRRKFWGRFLKEACVEGLRTYLYYGKAALLQIGEEEKRAVAGEGREKIHRRCMWPARRGRGAWRASSASSTASSPRRSMSPGGRAGKSGTRTPSTGASSPTRMGLTTPGSASVLTPRRRTSIGVTWNTTVSRSPWSWPGRSQPLRPKWESPWASWPLSSCCGSSSTLHDFPLACERDLPRSARPS